MFSGYTVLLDSKENKLGSSNQETPPSAGKNTGLVLVPFCACVSLQLAISGSVYISIVSGCHMLHQMRSQWVSQKLLQGSVSHQLTVYLSVFDLFLTQ